MSGPPRAAIAIEPVVEPTGEEPLSYARALRSLTERGVPFLVGGGIALTAYCGIRRNTKDLDVFVLPKDVPRVLDVLTGAGFRTETPYPHWLAKAHAADEASCVDVIFNSGNGTAPVDDEWFAHAVPATVLGSRVMLCPAEETIWSKAFVMERERFDGADVAHLLLARGKVLDWPRLMRRFAENWRVLLCHLVLFGYVFPDEARASIPAWVLDALVERLGCERLPDSGERTCRGTLLSREQYLPDLARGWRDARLPPTGTMSRDAVDNWTEAIRKR